MMRVVWKWSAVFGWFYIAYLWLDNPVLFAMSCTIGVALAVRKFNRLA